QAAQRPRNSQTFQVQVDGIVVGTFTPAGTSYSPYATAGFTVAAGQHTIAFVGTNPGGGDNTAFLDLVNVYRTVNGPFTYSPAAGTVLGAGSQTLAVTFTPNDTADYATVSASVPLTVTPATLTVTANGATRAYGVANPAFSASYAGFVNGE